MRSNSLWLDLATNKKMEKSGLTVKDLFEDLPSLKKKFIQKNDSEPLNEVEIDQRLNQLGESIRASSSEQKKTCCTLKLTHPSERGSIKLY